MPPDCPECDEELEFLDVVVVLATRWKPDETEYRLYICHNEDCDGFGRIYYVRTDDPNQVLGSGDPTGAYQ